MKRTTILHILYGLKVGGAEKVVLSYAKHLNREKYECIVCAMRGGPLEKDLRALNIKYLILNKKVGVDFLAMLKLFNFMRTSDIDIIHIHSSPKLVSPNLYGTIAALLSGRQPIYRSAHNILRDDNIRIKLFNMVDIFFGIFHKKIITVSDQVKKSYLKNSATLKNKLYTIYNGIDSQQLQISVNRLQFLNEFGLATNNIIIGCIANLIEQKGHKFLLQAVPVVLQRRPDARFLIVGDGPLKKYLEISAEILGVRDQVIFTGYRQDIPKLLQVMDIFVLPSLWEGFPIAILEAMASGRPVIATDVGGNSEAVIHNKTGIIVPNRNPSALAAAIIELTEDEHKMLHFGREGKRRFLEHFTVHTMIRKTQQLYDAATTQ